MRNPGLPEYSKGLSELFESSHDSLPEDTNAVWQEHVSQAERKKVSGWERGGPAGYGTTSNPQALGG